MVTSLTPRRPSVLSRRPQKEGPEVGTFNRRFPTPTVTGPFVTNLGPMLSFGYRGNGPGSSTHGSEIPLRPHLALERKRLRRGDVVPRGVTSTNPEPVTTLVVHTRLQTRTEGDYSYTRRLVSHTRVGP